MIDAYFAALTALLQRVREAEREAMEAAAARVAEAVAAGGVVHVFGCGHSHLLAEEVFYRAGTLAAVHPVLVSELMLHEAAVRASLLERLPGYGATVLHGRELRPGEVLFVVSNSGRNPVPVDVALAAREAGLFVVGITSLAYRAAAPSRHPSGRHLADACHLVIDTHVPVGDALLRLPGDGTPVGAASTVVAATVLHAVLARAAELLAARGEPAPVFRSGNVDGGDEHNAALIARYRPRVPALR